MKTIGRVASATRLTSPSKRLFRAAAGPIFALFFAALAPAPVCAQLSTDDHLEEPGWWPRRVPPNLKEFAGNAACAKCHPQFTASQENTPMACTLMPAAAAGVLHRRIDLAFRNGKYLYQIKETNAGMQLMVTDGERTITSNLVWAFGTGKLGQSYLFLRNGNYLESRVTYFSSLQNFHFTPTRALLSPHDLEEAEARPWAPPNSCDVLVVTALAQTPGESSTRARRLRA